jgi:hypothetical protein
VGFDLTTLVVIDTDCIGSYKSTYHATTTASTGSIYRITGNFGGNLISAVATAK